MEYFTDENELKEGTNKIELYEVYSHIKTASNLRKKHYDKIFSIRQLHIDEKLTLDTLNEII